MHEEGSGGSISGAAEGHSPWWAQGGAQLDGPGEKRSTCAQCRERFVPADDMHRVTCSAACRELFLEGTSVGDELYPDPEAAAPEVATPDPFREAAGGGHSKRLPAHVAERLVAGYERLLRWLEEQEW